MCLACRDTGHILEPDLTEAPPKPRRRADETDHDALRTRIRAVLNDPVHGIANQLSPLVYAYDRLDDVAMPLAWFRGHSPGLTVLADLAHHAHARPVDHGMLDTYPQTPALHWLRALLVATSVLPSRDELLDRVEPWLDRLLADRPAAHTRIIEPFVNWHLLRQARLRARRRPTGRNTATHIRTQARLAVEFLAWLDDRGQDLSSATQGDLELWLTGGRQTRYFLGGFISWVRGRGLCTNLSMAHRHSAEPQDLLDADDRWEHLDRCLSDETLPLDVRVAGALVLLYGRTCTDLHRLRAGDIQLDGDHSTMQIHDTTLPIPPALATLIRELTATAPSQPGHDEPSTASRWLFPGRATSQPTAAHVLARRLRRHGIAALPARHAARAAWATEIPVALAADLLGIHLSTAERWSQRVRRDWTDYIADRAQGVHTSANDHAVP